MDMISLFQQRIDERVKAHAELAWFEDYPAHVRPPKERRPIVPSQRGVYEVEFPPFGYRAFNLVTSIPGEVGYVQFPAHWVTRARVANLWRLLNHLDPPQKKPALEIVKSHSDHGP